MTHEQIDARSLAFGKAIADRLRADATLIGRAKMNIARWTSTVSDSARPVLKEWSLLLDGPIVDVIATLCGEDEESIRLRQSNPFAGLLPETERLEILKRFR